MEDRVVYISSTFVDLRAHREAAARAIRALRCTPRAMEDYVASDKRPVDKCLEDVRNAYVYVGLIGWRYGYRPPGSTKSITRLEYEEARKAGIPCLVFLVEEDVDWPRKWRDRGRDRRDLLEFRSVVKLAHVVKPFREFENVYELESRVSQALGRLLNEEGGSGSLVIPSLLPYMSDRSRQRDQLAHTLDEHHKNQPHRPMFAMVHGDEREAHHTFIERIEQVILPDLLSLNAESQRVHSVRFSWEGVGPRQERLQRFKANLMRELAGTRRLTDDELVAEVMKRRCPVDVGPETRQFKAGLGSLLTLVPKRDSSKLV